MLPEDIKKKKKKKKEMVDVNCNDLIRGDSKQDQIQYFSLGVRYRVVAQRSADAWSSYDPSA